MSYCSTLTDNQVKNVLREEKDRIDRIEDDSSEVKQGAQELYQEAREELIRRGISPDEVL